MGYRLEAWNDPSSSPHEVIIKDVPISVLNAGQELSGFTSGSLTISNDFPRLDEINDPANNVETLLRLFRDQTHICSFYAADRQRNYSDRGQTDLTGGDINTGLIHGIVYPFDYVVGEDTKQPDWIYGVDNRFLDNPGFEESVGSTGWEDKEADDWESTQEGSGFREPDEFYVEDSAAEARTGDRSLFIDPALFHSGAKKRFSAKAGGRYTFTVWVRSATTGRRITAGIQAESGSTIHHTNGFFYNGYALAELENVPSTGTGFPGGSTDGTWQSIDIDVTIGSSQESFSVVVQDDHHSFTNGPIFRIDDFVIAGPGLGLEPWTDDAFGPESTTTFEQSTTHVLSETYSARVVTVGNGANKDGIRQVIAGVEKGVTYTFGIWVYQISGVDKAFRAVLTTIDGAWIISAVTVVPTATWTFVPVTGIATGDELVVALRVVQSGSLEFWADDAVLGEGIQEATAGEIVQDLMEKIQNRGALSWINLNTFNDVNDSSGAAWDSPLKVRISRGRDMAQVMDLLARFGIEWFIFWTGTLYELKIYNRNGAGVDRTLLDGPKIFPGRGLTKAKIERASAGPNVVLAEGDEGILSEEEDVVLSAAYGRRETYSGTTDFLGTLGEVTGSVLEKSRNRKFGIKVEFSDADFSVWEDLTIGDLVTTDLPPDISNEDVRVIKITTTVAPQRQSPSHSVDFGRRVHVEGVSTLFQETNLDPVRDLPGPI